MRFYGAPARMPHGLKGNLISNLNPGIDRSCTRHQDQNRIIVIKPTALTLLACISCSVPVLAANLNDGPAAQWQCEPDADETWRCRASEAQQPAPAPAASPETVRPGEVTSPSSPATPAVERAPSSPDQTATPTPIAAAQPVEPPHAWRLCRPAPQPSLPLPGPEMTETYLEGDKADIQQNEVYVLTGNAMVERTGERILADQLTYNETKSTLDAENGLRIEQPDILVQGEWAHLNLAGDTGEIHQVRYQVPARHARGEAESTYQESADLKRMMQATYTTCDEGDEDWKIRAKQVNLHEDEGVGRAYHATLRVADIPVLYTPYISFPLDDRRKSGFLVPGWGSSDETGTDIRTPYYWNIAPNQDATITPRIMTKRGLQMIGEYRFLQRRQAGKVDLELLPSDNEYNDKDRHLFSFEHEADITDRLTTRIDFLDLSDKAYFEDLGTSLAETSQTYIRRYAQADYRGIGWNLLGRVDDYVITDPSITDKPYQRLPQLQFSAHPIPDWNPYGLDFKMSSELVRFDHNSRVKGTRFDIEPVLELPWRRNAYYVTPGVGVKYTTYQLQNTTAAQPGNPDRTVPYAYLDSGVFFERDMNGFGSDYLQTLEPRLFYLYAPYRNQDDLPRFDTGLSDFRFSQLFATNRFSNPDRFGDANQLTTAITSRILDPMTGYENLRFSIGQIFYFRDREVTLEPNATPETQGASNIISDFNWNLTRALSVNAGVQWDPYDSRLDRKSIRLQYQPDPQHILNFSHRFRDNQLEQVDINGYWYLTERWHAIGRWYYSLQDSVLLEGLAGLEYESCCWVVRLAARNYINSVDTGAVNAEGERNKAIMLQFELKGMTSFGDNIVTMMEQGILGYRRETY